VSWDDADAQADPADNTYDTWFGHIQNMDLTRGSNTQDLLAAVSTDRQMGLIPRGLPYNPQTERKGREGKEVKEPEQTVPDVVMANPQLSSNISRNRQTGAIGPQPQPQQREFKASALSDDDMNTTNDVDLRGHYGGLADYFMPNDSQKKRNAEAKTLKALAATSHPSVIFARKYFQEYDHTDAIERQALPMQRELTQRRVTLDTVVSQKTNPRDYELIKVLLDRDVLEADLALDPGDDELIERMDRVLERWRQIKLV
jgi:hypothetical protein